MRINADLFKGRDLLWVFSLGQKKLCYPEGLGKIVPGFDRRGRITRYDSLDTFFPAEGRWLVPCAIVPCGIKGTCDNERYEYDFFLCQRTAKRQRANRAVR